MLKDLFSQKKEIFTAKIDSENTAENVQKTELPDMWARCNGCGRPLYDRVLEKNIKVCPICSYHFRLTWKERADITFDNGNFERFNFDIPLSDPLSFPGYREKIKNNQKSTGLSDAVACGVGNIGGIKTAVCIMDSFFMMGSMGYAVGESITRTIEYAQKNKLPIIIFTASGGARMQEGIVSLMQMAKISGALQKFGKAGLPYFTVITHPTTGGVTASFASLGDVIIAEKGALIGFAGKRVIEQTIKQKLPKDFQTAEFAEEHGFVDMIILRKQLKETLTKLLIMHGCKEETNE